MSLKRSKSFDDLKFNIPTHKLLWAEWSKVKFVSYLNLIDYESKKYANYTIPWFFVPCVDGDIIQFNLRGVYEIYKPLMLTKIFNCNNQELLLSLIQKLLYIAKLFRIVNKYDEISCLYYNLAYTVLDKGCRDPIFLLTLWKNLCFHERSKVAVLSGCIGRPRRRKAAKMLRYTLEMAHKARFDFWGAWEKNRRHMDFNYCPVTSALMSGDLENIILLLQYGFLPNRKRLSAYDKYFIYCINYIYDWLRKPFLENCPPRRKLVTEVLLFLITTGACQSKTKRMLMGECFRIMWSAVSTPYVTREELYNEVRLKFMHPPAIPDPSNYFPSTEKHFMILCEYYPDTFFRDGGYALEPRSLKHLSRCAIREQLTRAWNLPRGIQYLPIPTHLKYYLRLGLE